MKDCNVAMYRSKYQKQRRRRACILLCIFLLILTSCFCYVFCVVNPIVVEATRSSIFSLSTSAVSDAMFDVLSNEGYKYTDIVNVEKDADGNVTFITLETVALNIMARKFYQEAQIYLDEMGKNGVDIALGTFTGLPFLVGLGPTVNIKLVPIGAMTSTFESRLTSAGVNQTHHSVFIHLYASVSLILPAYSATIDSVTEMLVAESVIVGKVPQVYFGNNSSLNFSPNI